MYRVKTKFASLALIAVFAIITISFCQAQSVEPPPVKSPLESVKEDLQAIILKTANSERRIKELNEQRASGIDQLDQLQVSESSFNDIMRVLQTQRIEMMIDLAGLDARREAVKSLNKTTETKTDSVIPLLEKMVASAKDNLQRFQMQYHNGSIPASQIAMEKQKLLELELRLAEAKSNTGSQPTVPNSELTTIVIMQAEKKARLSMIEKLLSQFVNSRPVIQSIGNLDAQLEIETHQRAELKRRSQSLQAIQKDLEASGQDNRQ